MKNQRNPTHMIRLAIFMVVIGVTARCVIGYSFCLNSPRSKKVLNTGERACNSDKGSATFAVTRLSQQRSSGDEYCHRKLYFEGR